MMATEGHVLDGVRHLLAVEKARGTRYEEAD